MKKLISCMIVVTVAIGFGSCDNETSSSPNVEGLLTTGIWRMSSVTVDGVNRNDLFPNLTIAFTPTGFSALNGEPVWPTSGTWSLASDQKSFTRDDGTQVMLTEVSENLLTLKLTWTKSTLGNGRGSSTEGEHVFVFGK